MSDIFTHCLRLFNASWMDVLYMYVHVHSKSVGGVHTLKIHTYGCADLFLVVMHKSCLGLSGLHAYSRN